MPVYDGMEGDMSDGGGDGEDGLAQPQYGLLMVHVTEELHLVLFWTIDWDIERGVGCSCAVLMGVG